MDERHALHESGKVCGLLHRGVTSTDNADILIAEERSVAHGAGTDTLVLELVLVLQAEVVGASSRGDDYRLGEVQNVLVLTDPHLERALRQIDLHHVSRDQLCTGVLGLFAEFPHHLLPGHTLRIAGIVLHLRGEHQLTARNQTTGTEALDTERF